MRLEWYIQNQVTNTRSATPVAATIAIPPKIEGKIYSPQLMSPKIVMGVKMGLMGMALT